MKRYIFIIVTALFFSTLGLQGYIPEVNAESHSLIIHPIADSYVDFTDVDDNFGASSILMVWEMLYGSSMNFGDRTYLKFDIPPFPLCVDINNAYLELYSIINLSITSSIGVHCCSDDSWSEVGITWNNAPVFDSNPEDICYNIAFEGWYSWNVTHAVHMALKDNTLTLVLNEAKTTSLAFFYSKESYYGYDDYRPKLTIEYSDWQGPVPGDMDGSGSLNSADVRFLSCHIVGRAGYETLMADGDVDCSGIINSADCRYLACHIVGRQGYENLYWNC
jgi:hypothetical protein